MKQIIDHAALSQFELREQGKLVYARYHCENGVLVIPHVEADPALRGTGAAGRLMQGIVDLARHQGLKIRPLCSYAALWMRRHPASLDVME